jgi:hypothetical protein
LLTWATANGGIGHSAIAVSNYKTELVRDKDGNVVYDENGKPITKQVEDGTYTVYQLAPAESVSKGNFDEDVTAGYTVTKNVTRGQLFKTDVSSCDEGRSADGIVGIGSDYNTDKNVRITMGVIAAIDKKYNGISNNCTDYAEAGVNAASGTKVNGSETINKPWYVHPFSPSKFNSNTPNHLFNQTRTLKNASVLKEPGKLVKNSFVQGVKP